MKIFFHSILIGNRQNVLRRKRFKAMQGCHDNTQPIMSTLGWVTHPLLPTGKYIMQLHLVRIEHTRQHITPTHAHWHKLQYYNGQIDWCLISCAGNIKILCKCRAEGYGWTDSVLGPLMWLARHGNDLTAYKVSYPWVLTKNVSNSGTPSAIPDEMHFWKYSDSVLPMPLERNAHFAGNLLHNLIWVVF